ncbi:DcaP family trimeric outer membrane transporter [uncultured Shimia sp.]|uniref:DcaP family trimeric outer membrane transporter n=1 Tax=uncultured Shimia sp. TaxID=573152 RepID=UPI00262FF22D|nr:DcaP family trimeric outer membrane transporter [uncultured Shimia sp.]
MTFPKFLLGLSCAAGFGLSPALAEEDNPLSFNLGSGNSLTFYGYIKASFIKDFDYDLGDTTSGLSSIGLPGGPVAGDSARAHLKETRLGADLYLGDVLVKYEGDFFGTNSIDFRTRHAMISWNGLMVGQYWTNFMSLENLGKTVDFQGPAGVPFARLPQIRYTYKPNDQWTLSGSIEEDKSNEDDVQFTFAARRGYENAMLRVAGIYRDTVISGTEVQGWGVSIGGWIDAWEGGRLTGIFTTGEAISDILTFGLDGNALTVGGNEVGVNALSLGVHQKIGDKLTLAATTGLTDLEVAFGTDTQRLTTLHLSAFYDVSDSVQLSAEFYTGTRKQGDGVEFDADRVMMAATFRF